MKETIDTIPLMDAMNAQHECPFCYLERESERHAIAFILGSAYMEDTIRMQTDQVGFCRNHYKEMFEYGNRLGSALMLSTHMKKMREELNRQLDSFAPDKVGLFKRKKRTAQQTDLTSLSSWIHTKENDCYVCSHIKQNYERYLDSFLELWKRSLEFQKLLEESKGFCLPHFADLVNAADFKLTEKQKSQFYPVIFRLMRESFQRLEEEVTWFTDKFDYRNRDRDWGNSKDSVQRCMQKLAGGYPADPPFQGDRQN